MNKRKLLNAVFCMETTYVPPDDEVNFILESLTPRERFLIEHRFSDQGMFLKEIAEIFPRKTGGIGVTRERVRQVEAKALRKLRHPSRARHLWPDWYLGKE